MANSQPTTSKADTASRIVALLAVIPLTIFGAIQAISPTALLAPGTLNSPGLADYADYGSVRNLGLIIAILYLAVWRFDRRMLGLFLCMMIVVEFLDAAIGFRSGVLGRWLPPFLLGCLMVFAARHLLRSSKTASSV